jgi:hypothetical protein
MMKIKGEDCGFNRMGLKFQKINFYRCFDNFHLSSGKIIAHRI